MRQPSNEEVTVWLRRKRLDERAFLLRRLEIRTMLTPVENTEEHQ